jgi:DNA primase small subunit
MESKLRSDSEHYYRTHFPATSLFKMVSREWEGEFAPVNREWGVETIDGKFKRWKSCSSADELRRLVSASGVGKLNIGAVYTTPARSRWELDLGCAKVMHDVGSELRFDIDLDDYPHLGVTKDDLDGCDRVWPVVALGLETAKQALESHFGFKHVLAVYSGRRGGHLWVLDRRAFGLSNEARAAIVAWLQPT